MPACPLTQNTNKMLDRNPVAAMVRSICQYLHLHVTFTLDTLSQESETHILVSEDGDCNAVESPITGS